MVAAEASKAKGSVRVEQFGTIQRAMESPIALRAARISDGHLLRGIPHDVCRTAVREHQPRKLPIQASAIFPEINQSFRHGPAIHLVVGLNLLHDVNLAHRRANPS